MTSGGSVGAATVDGSGTSRRSDGNGGSIVRLRIPAGLAVALLSLACVLTTGVARAHAVAVTPPDTVTDPAGDATLAPGDIVGVGFAQTSTSLVFGVKLKTPLDPATDATWKSGFVLIYWELDADNNGAPDYNIQLTNNGAGGMDVVVFPLDTDTCPGGVGAFVAGYGITVTLPTKCLPAGLVFRFRARMSYAPDLSQSGSSDFAPDGVGFGPSVKTAPEPAPPVTPAGGPNGYWMLGADGHVYPFGGAVGFPGLQPGAVAMTPRRDGKGYWVADGFGRVFAHGTAVAFPGVPQLRDGESITTIAATATGKGYWLFSNRGRVFAFGDAHSHGDLAAKHLKGPIVASTATASGNGYYMVGSDGGIFAFGDARFHGSTGALLLNRPVVGMAPTPTGTGYWLVASDGGVFAFDAPFRGSMGGTHLNQSVDGIVAYGNGYLMAAADGGVFDFSNRAFLGSLAAHPPAAPIIGLAAFST
jgi:hypothetical protein